MHFLSHKNEVDLELALTAVAATSTLQQASELMADRGMVVSAEHLAVQARKHQDELDRLREHLAPKLEARLANDMLDNASLATMVEGMAIERAQTMLEEGRIADPSKVARDLADVKAKSVDKRLALQGRPTQITEHRSVEDNWKALEALGVVEQVDVTDAEVVERVDGGL